MIDIVGDFHLHSKYSRAVSPQMNIPVMAEYGQKKGIDVLATGDWTHPVWFRELRANLEEAEEGLFSVRKKSLAQPHPDPLLKGEGTQAVKFLLSVEIATIYSQNGKGRRIHQVILVPSFETAEKVNKELIKRGFNLSSDGRPIIGLSSKNLLSLILEIDERSLLIPAHIWTPWFGIYGQMSGFNSLSEAFEDLAPKIYGIETGLSSDPEMNWQIDELNSRSILSFSDAHSPAKMGREATIFRLEDLSYENIRRAIMQPSLKLDARNKKLDKEVRSLKLDIPLSSVQHQNPDSSIQSLVSNKVLYTIEFYPEEGKYHYSGHRNCNVTMTPEEQKASGGICPVCHRKVTDGVMRRVGELAQEDLRGNHKPNSAGLVWITDPKNAHPPYVKIVPLQEIISEAIGSPVASPKVKVIFDTLCKDGVSEFHVLLKLPLADIEKICLSITSKEFARQITDGIKKVRAEQIVIQPGYDGVFGVVRIWNEEDNKQINEYTNNPIKKEEQIGMEF